MAKKMYTVLKRTCLAIVLLITSSFLPRPRCHRSRGLLKVPIKRWNLLQSLTNIYCGILENCLKGKVPLSTRFWLDSLVVNDSFEYFRINENLEKDITVKLCRSTVNF